ncbi:MAG: hypothetical protein GYA39_04730 [Methanothrix sp.]|nr:hypothetical protein [Methanothrix sp.]
MNRSYQRWYGEWSSGHAKVLAARFAVAVFIRSHLLDHLTGQKIPVDDSIIIQHLTQTGRISCQYAVILAIALVKNAFQCILLKLAAVFEVAGQRQAQGEQLPSYMRLQPVGRNILMNLYMLIIGQSG